MYRLPKLPFFRALPLFVLLCAFAGCAFQKPGKTAYYASFAENRTTLLGLEPEKRYDIVNGEGFTEEWKVVEVTSNRMERTADGHHDCHCTLTFQVKHWTIHGNQKVEPPQVRTEKQDRTIHVQ